MSNRFVIPLAILIGGALVAGATYFTLLPEPPEDGAIGDPSGMRPVSDEDYILGNPAAPIVFVEYADADCAYCAFQSAALRDVVASYGTTGDVAWVYRHFPLPDASTGVNPSVALECSGQIGGNAAFFTYLDSFTNAKASTSVSRMTAATQAANIPLQAFLDCANSEEAKAAVAADAKDALLAGATGVPYTILLVKDRAPVPMTGVMSVTQLKEIIEAARKGQQ